MKFSSSALAMMLILTSAAIAGPVSHFGMLKVCGNNICGEKTGTSTPVFFKGPSLFWSNGVGAPFYHSNVVDWFVENMQIGVIRAAMGIRYNKEDSEPLDNAGSIKGYYFDKEPQKALITTIIDAAIENDIYVVVDWHSHRAHKDTEPALAEEFFKEMANKYKNVPNIIWEVYNEPMSASTSDVSSYSKRIVKALRDAGNKNLVLVGSPSWSSKPNDQASDYKTASADNVAFTIHFYAAEHGYNANSGHGGNANSARSAGYAVFASEWGTMMADGGSNSEPNSNASDLWTKWMDSTKISSCIWAMIAKSNDYSQSAAMFERGTTPQNLSASNLTTNGKYFQNYMGKNNWTSLIPSNHPKGKDVFTSVNDGGSVKLTSQTSQLDLTGTVSKVSQPENGTATITDDGKSITYETSSRGSPNTKEKFTYEVTQGGVTIQSKVVVTINNRRPVLPELSTIAVSRKAPTSFSIVRNLLASDPAGQGLQITEVSISPDSVGRVAVSGNSKDTIVFTPASSMSDAQPTEATLKYTVRSGSAGATNSAEATLSIQNMAPTITAITNTTCCVMNGMSNTEPVGIGMKQFNGRDADGDDIWFERIYLDPKYPGRLDSIKPDSFVYYPPENPKVTGKVVFLAIITDGSSQSPVGRANLTLTGSGTELNETAPTEIPNVVPITQLHISNAGFGLKSRGFGKVEFSLEQSGHAKLDVYSLSGKHLKTLLNGWQSAGSSEISLKSAGLQGGVYILRLKQGSQVKALRVAN